MQRILVDEIAGKSRLPLLSKKLREGFDAALAGMRSTPGVEVMVAGDDSEAPDPTVLVTTSEAVRERSTILEQEMFGPAAVVVEYGPGEDLSSLARLMDGQLTATVHAEPDEDVSVLLSELRPVALELLAHRGDCQLCPAPRRPVSRHHGNNHFCGNSGDWPVHAAGCL